jgi:hypothetical protein
MCAYANPRRPHITTEVGAGSVAGTAVPTVYSIDLIDLAPHAQPRLDELAYWTVGSEFDFSDQTD